MLSSMPTFNNYQTDAQERPIVRKWFLLALVVSLAIHGALLIVFRITKLEHFTPYTERLVPRAFTLVGRADIDPKLLEQEPEKKEEPKANTPAATKFQLPEDKPSVEKNPDDVVFKPGAPDAVKPIVNDKPKLDGTSLQDMAKLQQSTANDLEKDLGSLSDQILKDKPKVSSASLLKMSDKIAGSSAGTGSANIPGLKSLDDALSGTGGLGNGDKIGIPGGALFQFDSAELRTDAIGNLQKLGTLVKKYPAAKFSIEGYTDSIGSPDYNLALSQRRAESVKAWLVTNMGVEPARISTRGFGSTKFIDSPTGSQEQQANNRRVEIAVSFPR
jgi:outer membrane protein OmpA-like peptidoglycan-associated protein